MPGSDSVRRHRADLRSSPGEEEAIRESERRFRLLFNHQFQFVALLSAEGVLLEVNDLPLTIAGIEREQVIGKLFWETPWWQDLPHMQKEWPRRLERTAQNQGQIFTEDEFRGSDGSVRIADAAVSAIRSDEGKVEFFIVQASDITERKRAEHALRETEVIVHTFYENAPLLMGVVELTENQEIVHVYDNPATLEFLGVADSTSGKKASQLGAPPEAIHQWLKAYRESFRTQRPVRFEYKHHLPSGSRWISAIVAPVRGAWNGRRFCYLGEDITERKNAEAALRESQSRYQHLFESIDQGFCVIEVLFAGNTPVDYRFLEVNPAFEKQTGLVNAVGKTVRQLVPNHERRWFEIYGKVALTGESVRFESFAQGLHRWYDVYAFRVGPPKGRKVAVLFADITERKNVEARLQEAQANLATTNQELERLVQERTAKLQETISELETFSYTVSHDLRSPLRAMQGFAHMTLDEYGSCLDEKGKDYLHRIDSAARRMDSLIQDVIAYNKVGREEVDFQPIDLAKAIDEVISQYPSVNMPHASFDVRSPLHNVMGNPSTLIQALSNLLTNAVKFVRAEQKAVVKIWTERSDSTVRIFVRDNGIGIPPQALPRIFEPFHRAHVGEGYGGTGIGLAIVQKAVKKMGGQVGVQSEVGKGSTFWIELQAAS